MFRADLIHSEQRFESFDKGRVISEAQPHNLVDPLTAAEGLKAICINDDRAGLRGVWCFARVHHLSSLCRCTGCPAKEPVSGFFLSGSAHVTPNARQPLRGPWLDAPLTFKPGSKVTRQNRLCLPRCTIGGALLRFISYQVDKKSPSMRAASTSVTMARPHSFETEGSALG